MHNPDYKLGLMLHRHMTMETALRRAFNALTATGNEADHDAATIVQSIIDQRGCDHLDTGSDKLTDAISVIIFG